MYHWSFFNKQSCHFNDLLIANINYWINARIFKNPTLEPKKYKLVGLTFDEVIEVSASRKKYYNHSNAYFKNNILSGNWFDI